MPIALPPQLHVFVRDWLSANHIVLRSPAGHVVIDAGYHSHAPFTLQLLKSRHGLGADPLSLLVNTHCHSDHMGGNAAVQAAYGCPIAVPEGEAPLIEAWDVDGLWLSYAGQYAPRFRHDRIIRAGETHVWGDLEWEALAAPGHDMGALVFHNRRHRMLISGDALWQNGFGVVFPPEMDPRCLPATRATLDMIAELDIAAVIPGHGEPFTDVRTALERAYSRVGAFEADSVRMARHLLKVMLTFSLLAQRRIREADLPAYCESVPLYPDVNRRYLGLAPGALAQMLVGELERARAVRREGEWLVPA
jgi:glyoxylase-like metal-dependent hydrolase (beta-lactamase superfamily II)